MRLSHLLATTGLALGLALPAGPASAADWSEVADALGKAGTEMPGGVYRVGLPRTDLKVTLDGVELKPALALGSWLAFAEHGQGEVMVMGDLVLSDEDGSATELRVLPHSPCRRCEVGLPHAAGMAVPAWGEHMKGP